MIRVCKRVFSMFIAIIMIVLMVKMGALPTSATASASQVMQSLDLPLFPVDATETYWIVFNEGYRNDRVEMSVFNIEGAVDGISIVWNRNLKLNEHSKFPGCNQYYINNGVWTKFVNNYNVMSDFASGIIASNLDVYDGNGKLIIAKTQYQIPNDTVRYDNNYYRYYSEAASWDDAKAYCERLGGHLATITSQDENDFLYNYLISLGKYNAYFGLSDNEEEGVWKWVTGEALNYTNWKLGEPNAESASEDYAMFYWKFTDGSWNDGNFGGSTVNGEKAFLCEWSSANGFISETMDAGEPGTAYLTLYDKDNETRLKNKAVTINGTGYTTSDTGGVLLNDLTSPTITIEVENYYSYRFDTEVIISSSMSVMKSVYTERLKESTRPYISSVYCKNVTANTGWKDAAVETIGVPENSDEMFNIKIHALERSSPVAKIVLSQDEAHKLESASGVFSNIELSNVFVKNKDIYAYCIADNGTVSKAVKTKISIEDTDNFAYHIQNTSAVSFDGGPKITISDSIPVIGGTEIAVDMGYFPISFTKEQDTYKVALGVEKDTFDWSKWLTYKNMLKSVEDQTDSIKKVKRMNEARKAFGGKSAAGKIIGDGDVDFNMMGYIEWKLVNGKAIITESYIGATVTAKYQWTQPFLVWAIPCYYEFGVKVEGEFSGTGKRIVPDSSLPFEWNIVLSIKPSVNLGGGVGVPKALSVGVNGRAEFDFHVDFSDKYRKIDLTLAAAVKAQAFILEYSWDLAKKTWTLYSGTYGSNKSNAMFQEGGSENAAAADILDPLNYQKIKPRDYTANTHWLGDRVATAAPNDIIVGNTETKMLQTSIYGDSRQQLVECGGKKILFWIADNTGRTAFNRTMLVYSVYNENDGTWSQPMPVHDDGTADFYPNVATDGSSVYIAWQNSKTVFDESTATMENFAAAGEISVVKYDAAAGTIGQVNTLTSNSTLDTIPVVACGGGNVKVVWVNNGANDVFGLTGVNSLYVSGLSGSTWSVPSVLKNNLTSVHSMDAAIENGKMYVAYAYDMGNDPQDTSDLEIFQVIQNGASITTSRLTDNAVLDASPQYGKIGGAVKLIWYSEGNLTALDSLDAAGTATLFENATTVNDSFTIAQSGIDISYIVWSQMVDEHVEFYATVFDGTLWNEPVRLTDYSGKALYPSAVVDDDGTMFIGYNNVAQTLVTVPGEEGGGDFSYYEDGQTDLCMLKVFQNTDISVSDENLVVHCEEVVPNGTLPLALTVTNQSTVFVNSVDVFVNDTLIETVMVKLLPGESADITVGFSLPAVINYTELFVKALPHGVADCDQRDNAVTAAYGLPELSIGEMTVEDTALRKIISATVSNDSAVDSGGFALRVREDAPDGPVLEERTYDNLAVGQSLMVNYSIEKSSVVFDEDGFKKYYFEVVSDSAEYSKGNNSNVASFSVEDSEGVTSEVLNWTLNNNIATVFGVIENREFNPYEVYAKIEIVDGTGHVIGCTLKKVTLATKEVYTLEEIVPYAGTLSGVRITVMLLDIGTEDLAVTIPSGVTEITAGAFAGCEDLARIVIPPSVTFISEGAFSGCDILTIYGFAGSYAEIYAGEKSIPFTSVYLLPAAGPACVVDTDSNFIYGLEPGMIRQQFESGAIQVAEGYSLLYSSSTIGTGTQVTVKKDAGGATSAVYIILIFGDVNGDGKIDSIDAGKIVDYENYIVTWDPVTDSSYRKAADLNGDGSIDSIDAGIAVDAENYLVTINQSTGLVQ